MMEFDEAAEPQSDRSEKTEIDPVRAARIEKEKTKLLASLAGGDFSSLTTKVAAMLNHYPRARNSDITLALHLWQTFQPDVYNEEGIRPRDLFKLERIHYIVRARAKIQNEYGLFQADEKIRNRRRQNEEVMQDAVLESAPARRVVQVFADETGKNHEYVIVAAVWVMTPRAGFKVYQAITKWKKTSPWATREIHFSKFGRMDFEPLKDYLGVVLTNREYLSFKVIAVQRSKTTRKIEEVIEKLHEHMLLRGIEHEIDSGRADLPREIDVTMDEEQSLDAFTLADMHRRLSGELNVKYAGAAKIGEIVTTSSRVSPLIQLADLVAGAVNRRLNHVGEKNYKDEMADWVLRTLDIALDEDGIPGLDVSVLFKV